MARLTFQELEQRYLHELCEISEGNPYREIKLSELHDHLRSSNEQTRGIMVQLSKKGFVEYHFPFAIISPAGIEEVEKNMEKSYAEEELLVLKKIFEMGKKHQLRDVEYSDLAKEVGDLSNPFHMIVDELENKRFLQSVASDGCVRISPRGIEFLQQARNSFQSNTGNTNNFNFHAPVAAFQNQTQNSTQNTTQIVSITNNPDFDKAISSMTEVIKTSSISNDDKEEFLHELQSIIKLAQKEPTPEIGRKGLAKIEYFNSIVKASDVALKLAPHLPAISDYFEKLLS